MYSWLKLIFWKSEERLEQEIVGESTWVNGFKSNLEQIENFHKSQFLIAIIENSLW